MSLLMAEGEQHQLPYFLYGHYKPQKAGWTNDIMDKNLLERADYYSRVQ